uniref:Uncharacterized protein n=1 Tax=Caenorhabditis japonica TaxID=281687 RepID=A0A8R1HQM3_CAEJA
MHEAFSRLINRNDEEMFAFFQPDTQVYTSRIPTSPSTPADTKNPGLFGAELGKIGGNIAGSTVVGEVTLSVSSLFELQSKGGTIHCEPMYYNMRVMIFEENCDKYVERVEKIAMACVPVFSNHISSGTLSHHQPTEPSTPL